MNAAERKNEIISILIVRHHITVKELADEFDVAVRTIKNEIQALSFASFLYLSVSSFTSFFAHARTSSLVGPCSTISWSKVPSFRTIADDVLPLALT
ncbi:HTH domain-containing protein [Lachnospiraceae bacterium MD335]|nr:HTH domain-containing protein [Lachnospiraceae bacterium MD335]